MITNIVLENFKCFRKVEVNPRLITVFIGPNGTGKSSVLQALALLKQSVDRGDYLRLDGPHVNVPGFDQLSPNFGNLSGPMSLAFSGSYLPPKEQVAATAGYGPFAYEIESTEGNQVVKKRQPPGIPERILRQLTLVPAIRGLSQPRYSLGPQIHLDVLSVGGLSQQESQTATNLAYSKQLENRISKLLGRVTGIGLRAAVVPSQQVEVSGVSSQGDVNIVMEGFGSNALLMLFLQLVAAERGATVTIEEPEIHLHPKAQAELASVLAEEAKAEDKQLIMTTHTEHILGRLLTLVAEKKLSKDELAVYAFEKDELGVCTASQVEVTEDGRVIGGLTGFFEADLAELDRYIKALQTDR